jgi:hypothetical protein
MIKMLELVPTQYGIIYREKMDQKISKGQKKLYFEKLFKHNQLGNKTKILSYTSWERFGKLILIPCFLCPAFVILGISFFIGSIISGEIKFFFGGLVFFCMGVLFSILFSWVIFNKQYIQLFDNMIFSYYKPIIPLAGSIYFANHINSVNVFKRKVNSRSPMSSGQVDYTPDHYEYDVLLNIENIEQDVSLICFSTTEKAEEVKQFIENAITKIKKDNDNNKLLDMFI